MLRALTYNIHGWRGMDGQQDAKRIARIIAGTKADVVTLNEVRHPQRSPSGDFLLETLALELNMHFVFAPTILPGIFADPETAFGNALLSRFPILAHAGHRLTTPDGHEPRGLLEARISISNQQTLTIYATHLDHKNEVVRLGQIQALLLWTGRDKGRSHLLMGDFNAVAPSDFENEPEKLAALRENPHTAHVVQNDMQVLPRLIKAGYCDCFANKGRGARQTYTTRDELMRIDYCFAAGELANQLVSCQRVDNDDVRLASDHFPVLTEFSI